MKIFPCAYAFENWTENVICEHKNHFYPDKKCLCEHVQNHTFVECEMFATNRKEDVERGNGIQNSLNSILSSLKKINEE